MMMLCKIQMICYLVGILALICSVESKDVKVIHTNGWHYHQYLPLHENLTPDKAVRFSVKCARDAHIQLAPHHDPGLAAYEIVLGASNNTINQIRGRCPCQEAPNVSEKYQNLLNAHEFRNFWVKTASGKLKTTVQVGLGDSDTPFIEWRDARPLKPMFLSFRSATPATWLYGYRDGIYDVGITTDRKQSVVIASSDFGQFFPLSDHVSHSADAVTLYFTAKTTGELKILLSPTVSTLGDVYLIGISGEGAYIRRQILGDNSAAFQQPGFVSGREKQRFWIRLTTDGIVMLGKGGNMKPVLQWRDPSPISPQLLSFLLSNDNLETDDDNVSPESADIQYGLGPEYSLASQQCNALWKGDGSNLPAAALKGGRYEEKEIYICRADHQGETIPGSYEVRENEAGVCSISHNFAVIEKTEFEILTGCKMKWVSASKGHVPEGSIVAGFERGEPKYYVVRVKHEGMLLLGKLEAQQRLAHVPYIGDNLPFTNYETLVQIGADPSGNFWSADDGQSADSDSGSSISAGLQSNKLAGNTPSKSTPGNNRMKPKTDQRDS